MHPQPNDRASRRHEPARPELKPGQVVTWKDVERRPFSRSHGQGTLFPRNRSPDRQRSLERRRRLAASGPMPPQMAAKLTTARLSVTRILGDEMRRKGRCTMCIDEIAARAGCSDRLVQLTLREIEEFGWVRIEERKLSAAWNDTNIVTIVSAEWLAWLRFSWKSTGEKTFTPRTTLDSEEEMRRASGAAKRSSGVGFARSMPRSPP